MRRCERKSKSACLLALITVSSPSPSAEPARRVLRQSAQVGSRHGIRAGFSVVQLPRSHALPSASDQACRCDTCADPRRPPPASADLSRPPWASANLCRPPPASTGLERPPPTLAGLRRPPPTSAEPCRPPSPFAAQQRGAPARSRRRAAAPRGSSSPLGAWTCRRRPPGGPSGASGRTSRGRSSRPRCSRSSAANCRRGPGGSPARASSTTPRGPPCGRSVCLKTLGRCNFGARAYPLLCNACRLCAALSKSNPKPIYLRFVFRIP